MKIIVGYTERPESEAALDRAIDEAVLRGATLVIIHSSRGGERNETEHSLRYGDALDELNAQLERAGIEHEVRHLVRGKSPAQDLLYAADEVDAELIVIGIRRRSPVGKLILGSHAQDILLSASVPVLCVPAADPYQE